MIKIKKIMKNKTTWKEEYDLRYDYIKNNIGHKKCFRKSVEVKLSDCIVNMSIADYIVNLIMWRPMIKFNMTPSKDTIMDCSNITQSTIKKYIDNIYVRPLRDKININTLNLELAKVIEKLKLIVEDFGLVMGITYNLYQICQEMDKSKEFKDILYTSIPSGMQPEEIEVYGKKRLKKLVNILEKSDTGFAPLLNSGVGINLGQLQEFMVVIGNKPDLSGNTYPVPINTNIMVGGLNTPTHYTLDATGGEWYCRP